MPHNPESYNSYQSLITFYYFHVLTGLGIGLIELQLVTLTGLKLLGVELPQDARTSQATEHFGILTSNILPEPRQDMDIWNCDTLPLKD